MEPKNEFEEQKQFEIKYVGELVGHNGHVTAIATTASNTIVSCSRDKSLILWNLTEGPSSGKPAKRFYGHQNFVEDVVVSNDGRFALSGSWDNTMRLWDLETGESTCRFDRHKNDVLSVSMSFDNRQIVSGSRDRSIILWNTVGEKSFILDSANEQCVSCVEFSPKNNDFLLFATWGGVVKKFDMDTHSVSFVFKGHDGPVQALSISPESSLFASGGKDGLVILWDLENNRMLHKLNLDNPVVSVKFNPKRFMLSAATEHSLTFLSLNKNNEQEVSRNDFGNEHKCTTIEWCKEGRLLYCGFKDGVIRILEVSNLGDEVEISGDISGEQSEEISYEEQADNAQDE